MCAKATAIFRACSPIRKVTGRPLLATAAGLALSPRPMRREGCLRSDRQVKGAWRDTYIYAMLAEDFTLIATP